jgi:Ca2+-binding EF-hand superfamily protein
MKVLIPIAAALMFAGTAVAGDDAHEGKHPLKNTEAKFKQLDRNGDAKLSKAEASKDDSLSAEFAALDQDSDGFVTKTEFAARADMGSSRPSPSSSSRDESRR